jgi:hypothetical protein
MQGERTDLPPMPKCQCGCGKKVKRRHNRFLWGHIPLKVKQLGGRSSGAKRRFLARRIRFEKVFRQYLGADRCITKAAIFDAFAEIDRSGYMRGYRRRMDEVTPRRKAVKQARQAA